MYRLAGEKKSVQNPILDYAQDIGWNYLSQDEALRLRSNTTSFLFKDTFIQQLHKLNPDFMNNEIAGEIISKLERLKPNIEGNLECWEYLKGIKTAFVAEKKRELNVTVIDTNNINNNTFHVTDEFSFTNGKYTIRQDVTFLINGIPVFFIEAKSAGKRDGMSEALEQVKRYHRECPELLTINQVYAITHLIKYLYSSTWNTSAKGLFNWKEEAEGDFEKIVKAFLDRKRMVKLITDYILFTRKDDELSKVVLRPHQMRAVENVIKRAESKKKKRGLIWHTQGSGKTYTMIVTAHKIIENLTFENPTVIMLIDRNELQAQLAGNITSIGIEEVEIAASKANLRKLLKEDTRGLIVSMIHKFDDLPANLNTRNNIFVLVDEAHRTTTGSLGNYLMGALPNATYIGFTGTPIDKTAYGKGTFVVFGKDDPPHGYLDRYDIAESIADGTTVPLHYTLAPNNLLVDKDTLDKEFFSLAEAEGVSDIDELNKVLQGAVTLKNMLKNHERIQKVAKHMSEHYKEYVEPLGYKAFLVGVDRESCAMYKDELDKYFPKNYSTVVYSSGHNDDENLAKYHLSEQNEKQVRKNFRNPNKMPKILIVTEKLLTGYDAPVLYCMYLDKPMRDHVLLQTIARVNRPYEDENGRKKPSGFILDYVGIFENLEKALIFDSQDIEGVVKDIEFLKMEFEGYIKQAQEKYFPIIKGKKRDKAIEAVLDLFMDEDTREQFYEYFKELSEIHDIISPDSFLRPYINDYETLVEMYKVVKENFESKIDIDKEFSKKTEKLVQEHTTSGKIQTSLDIYELDENLLQKIDESNASNKEKVFNLIRTINNSTVKEDAEPYLIAIGEKATDVAERFKKRQSDTIETLEELKELIEEINKARQEQADKNIPDEIFSIFWTLKSEGIEQPEKKANKMMSTLHEFPHIKTSEHHEREVRKALYKIVLKSEAVGRDVTRGKEVVEKIIRVLKGG